MKNGLARINPAASLHRGSPHRVALAGMALRGGGRFLTGRI